VEGIVVIRPDPPTGALAVEAILGRRQPGAVYRIRSSLPKILSINLKAKSTPQPGQRSVPEGIKSS